VSRRRLGLAVGVLGSLASAAMLYVAATGSAGTSDFDFRVTGAPAGLTRGGQGLVIARFTPSRSGGAASHTVISFHFPAPGAGDPVPDPATSSDCSVTDAHTVVCAIGTVQPGVTVKRFVTFTAGQALGDPDVSASLTFDNAANANGGGQVDGPTLPAEMEVVDGATAAGNCKAHGDAVATAKVDKTTPQQTSLSFGDAANPELPCAWGTVGVQPNSVFPETGAPEISSVGGPVFGTPAQLTLTFSSLPVPLKHFVLRENKTDPSDPDGWKPVVPCVSTKDGYVLPAVDNFGEPADACLIGIKSGKVIVATLLYAGTSGDPWFT